MSKDYDRLLAIRHRNRSVIHQAKDQPCVDCRQRYPYYVMDFDHVRGKKEFTISKGYAKAVSMARLLSEMAKCEVVCANCHRIRTELRRLAVV